MILATPARTDRPKPSPGFPAVTNKFENSVCKTFAGMNRSSVKRFLLLLDDIVVLYQVAAPTIAGVRFFLHRQAMPFTNIKQNDPAYRIENHLPVVGAPQFFLRVRQFKP